MDALGQQLLNTTATIARVLAQPDDRRKTIVAIGASSLFDTPIPPPQVGRELLHHGLRLALHLLGVTPRLQRLGQRRGEVAPTLGRERQSNPHVAGT